MMMPDLAAQQTLPGMPGMPPEMMLDNASSGTPLPPLPSMEPKKIVELVDRMERERSLLHQRMDEDYSRWRRDPYTEEKLAGFAHFTSNDAQTYFNWHMGVLTTSQVVISVNQPAAHREQRQIDNMKEMFVRGGWRAIDERRANLLQPPLVDGMAWQVDARGRRAQRVLIVKELDPNPPQPMPEMGMGGPPQDPMSAMSLEGPPQAGPEAGPAPELPPELAQMMMAMMPPPTRSYLDVTDWDPRNTYWKMGLHGLLWACHKSKHTRDEIITEYGIDPNDHLGLTAPELTGEAEREWWRYEWFDGKVGMVILEDGVLLKPPTPHGMPRVPVVIGMVGPLPFVQVNGEVHEEDYGESIFAPVRDVYDETNFIMSIMKELSHRSANQSMAWPSRDGTTLPEENPRLTGTDIAVGIGEEPKPIPNMEMVRETGAFLGLLSAMKQRGSTTDISFGNPNFQLSGYAINSLKRGELTSINFQLLCLVNGLKQVFDLLCDAYATGAFDVMTLSGRMQDAKRSYFSQAITPELVAQGGILEVDLVPALPQDDAAKVTVAQMLRESPNGVPLADDRFIRQEIMDFQDVDLMERAVMEQQARTAAPTALAYNLMMAAAEQGDMELAQHWFLELQIQMMQKMMEMGQLQMMGVQGGMGPGGPAEGQNGNGNSGGPNGGRGRRPSAGVLPGPAQGLPPTEPTPQQGPIAAPGTPRPSRQGQRPEPMYGPGATPPWAR